MDGPGAGDHTHADCHVVADPHIITDTHAHGHITPDPNANRDRHINVHTDGQPDTDIHIVPFNDTHNPRDSDAFAVADRCGDRDGHRNGCGD